MDGGRGSRLGGAALLPPCKVLVQAVGSVTTPVTLCGFCSQHLEGRRYWELPKKQP